MTQKLKKNYTPVQYKSFQTKEVNFDEDSRTVTGYLATWGFKDSDDDILLKGCCAKSLQERGVESNTNRKIAFCWMHNMNDPIGKFLKLEEDDYGLYFEAKLDDPDAVPNAKRAMAQLKSGTLNQFSIGFIYVWDKVEYSEDQDAFIVKEINLFEGSVVTMGANEMTYFAGMKNIEDATDKLRKETEKSIKALPEDLQYNIRQIISKNIALSTEKPTKPLRQTEQPQPSETFDFEKALESTTFFN